MNKITEITNNDNGNYVIDWFAPWCGPCKIIDGVLKNVKKEFPDINFKKINVDENSDLANSFGIRSIPTLIFVKNNKIVETLIGVVNEEKLKETITELLLR